MASLTMADMASRTRPMADKPKIKGWVRTSKPEKDAFPVKEPTDAAETGKRRPPLYKSRSKDRG